MTAPVGFKQRLRKRQVSPSQPITGRPVGNRRSIPLPYQQTSNAPLWDEVAHGREITVKGVADDTAYLYEHPERFREVLRDYIPRGPDISQPVPLTPNPFKKRRVYRRD